MRAMLLEKQNQPLLLADVAVPEPAADQILIKVRACGLCRTDLHILDGELDKPVLPLIPGHQVVGIVEKTGKNVRGFSGGQRVGVPWLGSSCGHCRYCLAEKENLCDEARFTGYQVNGGLAEYCVADTRFCFSIPDEYPDDQAAPLLCAGLIGYRALRKTGNARRLGVYGFGAAAHLLLQVARHQGREVYAFTREGDREAQQFALTLGAVWAGASSESPPELLDAAIIFAPAGELVPVALRALIKGGVVVCGGIHMSDIPSFPYEILWGERAVCSVANLTRQDGEEFLALAPKIPIHTEIHIYPLEQTNEALADLRSGRFTGAYVIKL
ncbi:putative alcohol dehydrogenase AdhA [Aquicella siphonis]|uniref:alcohol dehydrogenase n=1 Tax=Aquicella siphonis TaxID=254247 RepID=A0A5E4PFG7_9COXI|nr:zinc-dependent alcohol dehydrogenase family protein [Aquicella siphonis]VVC75238.1 putative alcohol dehydrogenase AdhA [Aquicella siphonis]